MLSADAEITAGTGDPDSDVPPELFNDLEGKLDSEFVSARANVAPNPNDMDPEEARDDFQIEQEQEPSAPSTRLDQDALDILHAEAEYSSGEKPPAAAKEDADTLETTPADTLVERVEEDMPDDVDDSHAEDSTEEIDQETETPPEPAEKDDLDEIRQRIQELELEEDNSDTQADTPEPIEKTSPADDLDDLIAAEFGNSTLNESQKLAAEQTDDGNTPFRRPEDNGSEKTDQPAPADDTLYEEIIPQEEEATTAPIEDRSIDDVIDTLVAEQVSAVENESRPRRKVSARRFPNIDDASDDLYGAPEDRGEALKNLLPDVDELSSEIARDSVRGTGTDEEASKVKARSGFMKGFKYAILLYIFIGILYFLKPFILEYIPQAEGFLNLITKLVDVISNFIALMLEKIKGLIG
jgi:hypothetical protein